MTRVAATEKKSEIPYTLVFVVTGLLFCFLVLRSAVGPRGTDQYWYIAEVENIGLHHSITTNAVYPNTLKWQPLRLPPPPIHNILPIYVVAPLARLIGGYKAWVLVDSFCALLSASLTSMLVYWLTKSRGPAVLAFSLFLLMPLTVWQSSQPLAEMVVTVPVIAATLIFVSFQGFKSIIGALFFTGVAYLSRESFAVPLLMFPLLYLLSIRPFSRAVLIRTLCLIGVSGIFIFVHSAFMPQNVPGCPTTVRLLTASPGTDNMTCWYDLKPVRFPARQILSKIWRSLSSQVAPRDYSLLIFYLPFDVLSVASALLVLSPRVDVRRLGIASLLVLCTHLATIMVWQNEFRYMEVFIPVVVAGAVVWLTFKQVLSVRRWLLLACAFVCLTSPINFALVGKIRHDAAQDQAVSDSLRHYFSFIPHDENIMLDVRKAPSMPSHEAQIIAYTASPRLVLSIDSSAPCTRIDSLQQTVQTTWLFASSRSPLLKLFSNPVPIPPNVPILPPFAEWRLYRIGRASCSVPGNNLS